MIAVRRGRAAIAGGAAALALAGSACAAGARTPGGQRGSADLLATGHGVVWSFQSGNGSIVLRSPDYGRHWRVALPRPRGNSSLVASYFLDATRAWLVQSSPAGGQREVATVDGTSDGGRHWWHGRPLPGNATALPFSPGDRLFFADASHGWFLAVGGGDLLPPSSSTGQELLQLWRTTDGGHTWTSLPSHSLPRLGLPLSWAGPDRACLDQPSMAFANSAEGWLSPGACGAGKARPHVWRTDDGGQHWSPVALPAPPGGWGNWDAIGPPPGYRFLGGVDVGVPRLVRRPTGAEILLPVAVGRAGLVIEKSADAGRTWRIAARVSTRSLPAQSGPAGWFDPVTASRWVVSAPGQLLRTADAGRSWTFARSAVNVLGGPASFTTLRRGFVQGDGGLIAAFSTSDGGQSWTAQRAPRWEGSSPAAAGPAVSTIELAGPRLAVAAGTSGVQTSADGGRTWTRVPGVFAPLGRVDIVSDRVWFALTSGGLIRTLDRGLSWQPVDEPAAGPVGGVSFWTATDGVASLEHGDSFVLTTDGGAHWRPLRLAAGWSALPGLVQNGRLPAAVCFARGGAGWAVASHDHRFGVLVTADGGRHWRVGMRPSLVPRGSSLSIAGCAGSTGWVTVARLRGDNGGAVQIYDLLRSTDLGRSWLDVLRTPGCCGLRRPAVAVPPGGPALTGTGMAELQPLAVASPRVAWYTVINESGPGFGFGSTADAGISWSGRWFTKWSSKSLFPSGACGGTTAYDARHAWMLCAAPKQPGVSDVYGTSDGGKTWRLITVFRSSG